MTLSKPSTTSAEIPDQQAYRSMAMAGAEQLGADLASLSIRDLYSLTDGLRTLSEVLSALYAQPRFVDEDATGTRAGSVINNILSLVNRTRLAILHEAETRIASDEDEADKLFSLLVDSACEGFASPHLVAAEVSRIAAGVVARQITLASMV